MAIGTLIALWLWAKQRGLSAEKLWQAAAKPLEIAGVIILITSAGGAFGAMIKHSGIGNAIELATEDFPYSLYHFSLDHCRCHENGTRDPVLFL